MLSRETAQRARLRKSESRSVPRCLTAHLFFGCELVFRRFHLTPLSRRRGCTHLWIACRCRRSSECHSEGTRSRGKGFCWFWMFMRWAAGNHSIELCSESSLTEVFQVQAVAVDLLPHAGSCRLHSWWTSPESPERPSSALLWSAKIKDSHWHCWLASRNLIEITCRRWEVQRSLSERLFSGQAAHFWSWMTSLLRTSGQGSGCSSDHTPRWRSGPRFGSNQQSRSLIFRAATSCVLPPSFPLSQYRSAAHFEISDEFAAAISQ